MFMTWPEALTYLCQWSQAGVDIKRDQALAPVHTCSQQPTLTCICLPSQLLNTAGLNAYVCKDIESWLRSHAAFAMPILAMANLVVLNKGRGASWGQAAAHAHAMTEGFAIVRQLGNSIIPRWKQVANYLPHIIMSALMWSLSRMAFLQFLGGAAGEARLVIGQMVEVSDLKTTALTSIRPANG